jgi:hypothetical protein
MSCFVILRQFFTAATRLLRPYFSTAPDVMEACDTNVILVDGTIGCEGLDELRGGCGLLTANMGRMMTGSIVGMLDLIS